MRRLSLPFVLFSLVLLLNACSSTTQVPPETPAQVETNSLSGLTGHYFNNASFEGTPVTRVDNEISFDWGDQAPINGVSATGYSVRWTGQVQPEVSGSYTFELVTTGQARLLVNGVVAAQVGWNDPGEQLSQPVDLEAGAEYDLTLEYKAGDVASAIRLEWQRGGDAASVVPSAALSSTGSNLDAAIATLQADATFSALGVQLDLEHATGTLTPSGYGLVAQHPTEAVSYIVSLEAGPASSVQALYSLAVDAQDNAVFSDLKSGRSVALADMGSYLDEDGGVIPARKEALAATLYEFFVGTSGGLSAQSLRLQQATFVEIPSCASCQVHADNLEVASKAHATSVSASVIGIYAWGIGGAVERAVAWGLGSTPSVVGLGSLPGTADWVEQQKDNYRNCIEGKLPKTEGCPPLIEVTPRVFSTRMAVGESQSIVTTVANKSASPSRLFWTVERVGSVFDFRYQHDLGEKSLDPGESVALPHVIYCAEAGPVTGTIEITHNADNEASPITIPVALECYEPEPDISELDPSLLQLEAEIYNVTTGSFSFSNNGTADLAYTVSQDWSRNLNIASPKSGTVAPNGTATVMVNVSCSGVPTTRTFTVYIKSNDPDTPKVSVAIELECWRVGEGTRYLASRSSTPSGGFGVEVENDIYWHCVHYLTPGVSTPRGDKVYQEETFYSQVHPECIDAAEEASAYMDSRTPTLMQEAVDYFIEEKLKPNQCIVSGSAYFDFPRFYATVRGYTNKEVPSRPYCAEE